MLSGRLCFSIIYVTKGSALLNLQTLRKCDQASADDVDRIVIEAKEPSGQILIDFPSCTDCGYDVATIKA